MNSSARDTPGPAATAVDCPQCRAQLRLLQPATIHTPISCCMCGATFYMQVVQTAPLSDAVVPPRRPTPVAPGSPLRLVSPPPPAPAEPEPVRRPQPERATSLSVPAPPVPTHATPGMPRPVVLPEHLQRNFRTHWMESVLPVSLVLLLLVAACAGGFVLLRSTSGRSSSPRETTAAEPEPPAPAAVQAAAAEPKPGPVDDIPMTAPMPLARPDRLVGEWDSRADDGSQSAFDFHADGTVVITPAGDPPQKPLKAAWKLVDQKGDDMLVEVGQQLDALGNWRFTFRFTSPDAFTLVRTIRMGMIQPGDHLRYIRMGPPRYENAAGIPPLPAAGQRPSP